MQKEVNQNQFGFQVVCAWCGAVIRQNSAKNSQGMCLQCYARILREHNRSYAQAGKSLKASER